MGADEALLASVEAGGAPALRFYGWDGPWLSLGYGQSWRAEGVAACAGAGVGVVTRATGGRAVLHGNDLTYAVAAPPDCLPRGLGPCYELLAGALRAALRALGIPVDPVGPRAGPGERGAFDCFAAAAPHELVVRGRKLVGSAQRRTAAGVLQHGSIRLAADPVAARRASGLEGTPATSLDELGCRAGREELQDACIEAFSEALDARLVPDALDAGERSRAELRGPHPARRA